MATPQEADDKDLDDDTVTGSTSTGYKPGGHGIHRPLTDEDRVPPGAKAKAAAKAGAEFRAKVRGKIL